MDWGDLGVTALVSGVISSLIGIWFKHRAELSIVRAQAELEKEAIRHQITYGSLHQKRFEFLVEFYPAVTDLGALCQYYVGVGDGAAPELYEKFNDNLNVVHQMFDRGRVLLPRDLDQSIYETLKRHGLYTRMSRSSARATESAGPNGIPLDSILRHQQNLDALNQSVEKMRTDIRVQIARLIGVEE